MSSVFVRWSDFVREAPPYRVIAFCVLRCLGFELQERQSNYSSYIRLACGLLQQKQLDKTVAHVLEKTSEH